MERKPNINLSQEEKSEKKRLKRILKLHQRIKKCKRRLHSKQNAATEKEGDDSTIHDETIKLQQELINYQTELSQINKTNWQVTKTGNEEEEEESEAFVKGRRWIVKIYNQLILDMKQKHVNFNTTDAYDLLQSMTKASQTEEMFEKDEALLGYTRLKFTERALLSFSSMIRGENEASLSNVKDIVCVGCGPGCDGLGALTFLRMKTEKEPSVERILFMDYVMPQWKKIAIDSLIPLISKDVKRCVCASLDVRYSLTHPKNSECQSKLNDDNGSMLVVISYLLTETRGKWHDFMLSFLKKRLTKPTMILMMEPTAWMLHVFLREYDAYIDRVTWLDSSRDSKDLQGLDNRMGPAILLVTTK